MLMLFLQYKIMHLYTILESLLFTILKFEETSELLLYLRLSKYFKAFSLFFLPSEFSLEEIPHIAKSDLSFFTFLWNLVPTKCVMNLLHHHVDSTLHYQDCLGSKAEMLYFSYKLTWGKRLVASKYVNFS